MSKLPSSSSCSHCYAFFTVISWTVFLQTMSQSESSLPQLASCQTTVVRTKASDSQCLSMEWPEGLGSLCYELLWQLPAWKALIFTLWHLCCGQEMRESELCWNFPAKEIQVTETCTCVHGRGCSAYISVFLEESSHPTQLSPHSGRQCDGPCHLLLGLHLLSVTPGFKCEGTEALLCSVSQLLTCRF